MTLPKPLVPTYTTTLPISKKEVKYRPFLVKEEKAMMIAFNDSSTDTLINTIGDVLASCTFNVVDIKSLSMTDIEYLFLQLRIKSKGSTADVVFKCGHLKDDTECGAINEIQIDLNQITVDVSEENTKKIMLDEDKGLGIIMKYPTIDSLKHFEQLAKADNVSAIYNVFSKFIETIFDKENVYDTKDYSDEDMEDWFESLLDWQFKKIQHFFETLPKLKIKQTIKCWSCGHTEDITLEGLKSFLE